MSIQKLPRGHNIDQPRREMVKAAGAAALLATGMPVFSFEGAELYAGEKALYEAAAKEGLVVSFDTGPEWANWKSLFRDFKKRYPEVEMTYNDLGSAATVVALDKTRRRPQADTAYYFAASAVDAVKKDVVAPFTPINFDKLPAVFREPQGRWFTIHTLNIAFLVNKKLVKNVPTSWADLLKPEYKSSVVYLDPRSTGVGQVLVFAAAYAAGGDVDNVKPGIDYLEKLHGAGNVMRVEGTTPYAKFLKGEIPVWISYENDGLKAKHVDGMADAVEVVIPKEASVAAPYAISLVKGGPNPNAGKLWLNFIMSDVGQGLFAQGFVRPAVPGVPLPADVQARMPAASQLRPLDVIKASERKAEVDRLWAAAVLK
jgi:putative spermidine/putrescine transport system substrate-binding protein